MPAASGAQMTTWRNPPYWAQTFAYLLAPEIVFKARVNAASFTYPATTITFDTVTVGAVTDLIAGMTLHIGSADKLHDRGRLRIVSATSTVLTVPRFSRGVIDGTADLADNLFLTVYRDWRVSAKIPHIDTSTFEQLKDGYVTFGVNSARPPKANILFEADNYFVNSGTSLITVDFTGDTSYATAQGATIASYAWNFGSTATPATATTANVTGVTFPAGKHWISLTVTDSNGITHTMRQFIPACEPTGVNAPLYKIEGSLTTRKDGQNLSLTIYDDINELDYPDGTLVFVWQNEYYGNTQTDLSATTGRKKHKFYGWHLSSDESLKGTRQGLRKNTKLEFVDVAGRLKVLPGFPIRLQASNPNAPTHWGEINDGNIDHFVHHILQWHSTALDVAPFYHTALAPLYQFSRLDTNAQNLFDTAREKTEAIAFNLNCDTKGALRMVIDAPLADANEVVVPLQRPSVVRASVTESDIADISYDTTAQPSTYWNEANAVSEGTNTFVPVFTKAPGSVPAQGTNPMSKGNQMVRNPYQDNLNIREGHRFARANAQHNRFRVSLTHNGDLFEPALGEWLQITIGAAYAARRGLTFTNARFLIDQIDTAFNGKTKQVKRTYTLEKETSGTPGQTIDVESGTATPYELPGDNSLSALDGQLAAFNADSTVYVTSDFNANEPTWVGTNLGVTGIPQHYVADPFVNGAGWLVTTGGGTSRVRVYHVTDVFGTPTATLKFTSSAASVNTPARIHASRGFQNRIMVSYWMATGCYVGRTTDNTTWTETLVVGNVNTSPDSAETLGIFYSDKVSGKAYCGGFSVNSADDAAAGKIYVSLDDGATWNLSTSPDGAFLSDGGNSFLVPYNDNSSENILYARRSPAGLVSQLVRIEGTVQTDISPNGNTGPVTSGYSISASPLNRNLMVCSVANAAIDIAVFKTTSGGLAGWHQVTEFADFTEPGVYWNVEMIDDSRVILWGDDALGLSLDFCATIQSRLGNLPTSGIYFVGICRGA